MKTGAGPAVEIMVGDCRAELARLPAESVQCVVTSPPYWGLRDYNVDGQIGLERSVAAHLRVMVEVFAAVKRVLRPDGTLWVNYGDAYASSVNGRSAADTKAAGGDDRTFRDKPLDTVKASGLKPKDLIGLPWRLALALQADGWWLRRDIIWHKPNPMPESARDRPTTAHEYVFLLTKAPRYYYDAAAIRTDLAPNSLARLAQDVDGQEGSPRGNGGEKSNGNMKAVGGRLSANNRNGFRGELDGPSAYVNQASAQNNSKPNRQRYKMPDGWDTGAGAHVSIHREGREKGAPPERVDRGKRDDLKANGDELRAHGANARSVWTIPTEGFSEAHFATFPTELARRCILAGSRPGDLVLDPFGGAGTTGLVAARCMRRAQLIELNPDYAAIAHRRLKADLIDVAGGDPMRGLEPTPLETAVSL